MLLKAAPSFNSQYQLLLPPELMMPKYWFVPLLSSNAQEKLVHEAVLALLPGGQDVVAVRLLLDGGLAGECATVEAGVVGGRTVVE